MAARIVRTVSPRPTNSASPIMKWPMLSSTISGSAAIVSAVDVVEAVAGMDFQPGRKRQRGPATMRCHSASAFAV